MKRLIIYTFLFFGMTALSAQNISINANGSAPDNSAMLDVSSTTSGLIIPRMTLVQRNALTNPANSLLIYQTDNTPGYYYNSGTTASPVWTPLSDNLGNHTATTNIQLGTNYLSGDGGNEGIRIDANGNVGIKQPTPGGDLHVSGVGYPSTIMESSNTRGSWLAIGNSSVGGKYYQLISSGSASSFGAGKLLFTYGNSPIGVTGTSMVIADDMVGIGTGDPSAPLNVKRIVGASANDGSFIDIQNGSGVTSTLSGIRFKNNSIDGNVRYNAAIFHRVNTSSDYQLNFAVQTNVGVNLDTSDIKMTINDDGNVGIGTTAPSTRLTVSLSTPAAIMNLESSGSNTLMDFNNSGTNPANWRFGYLGNTGVNPGYMTFLNGSHRMVITNNGDVGIGTTNPSSKLEVTGDIEIPVSNDYTYSTAKTHYQSFAPTVFNSAFPDVYDFRLFNVATNYTYFSGGSLGSIGYASVVVNLPNGATVTEVRGWVMDNSARPTRVRLMRQQLGSGSTLTMGTAQTVANSASIQNIVAPIIISGLIDNQTYSYYLMFEGGQADPNTQLFGARITYTVTEVD